MCAYLECGVIGDLPVQSFFINSTPNVTIVESSSKCCNSMILSLADGPTKDFNCSTLYLLPTPMGSSATPAKSSTD